MILVFACGVSPSVSLVTVEKVTNRDQGLFAYMFYSSCLILSNCIALIYSYSRLITLAYDVDTRSDFDSNKAKERSHSLMVEGH